MSYRIDEKGILVQYKQLFLWSQEYNDAPACSIG